MQDIQTARELSRRVQENNHSEGGQSSACPAERREQFPAAPKQKTYLFDKEEYINTAEKNLQLNDFERKQYYKLAEQAYEEELAELTRLAEEVAEQERLHEPNPWLEVDNFFDTPKNPDTTFSKTSNTTFSDTTANSETSTQSDSTVSESSTQSESTNPEISTTDNSWASTFRTILYGSKSKTATNSKAGDDSEDEDDSGGGDGSGGGE